MKQRSILIPCFDGCQQIFSVWSIVGRVGLLGAWVELSRNMKMHGRRLSPIVRCQNEFNMAVRDEVFTFGVRLSIKTL
jgi:hypothetical protein